MSNIIKKIETFKNNLDKYIANITELSKELKKKDTNSLDNSTELYKIYYKIYEEFISGYKNLFSLELAQMLSDKYFPIRMENLRRQEDIYYPLRELYPKGTPSILNNRNSNKSGTQMPKRNPKNYKRMGIPLHLLGYPVKQVSGRRKSFTKKSSPLIHNTTNLPSNNSQPNNFNIIGNNNNLSGISNELPASSGYGSNGSNGSNRSNRSNNLATIYGSLELELEPKRV